MDDKTLERSMKTLGYYDGPIDGVIAGAALDAVGDLLANEVASDEAAEWRQWSSERQIIAAKQVCLREMSIDPGIIDGRIGPSTQYAFEVWQDRMRAVPGDEADHVPVSKILWPTQVQVPAFYGPMGQNQKTLQLPYLMYYENTPVKSFLCHSKVHDSMGRVLAAVLAKYGPAEIHRLKLDLYSGCLNVRKMRGGNAWSMHSWGIAVDIDAADNQLRWGKDQALFGRPEYVPWFECWEAEGAVSLGRARGFDFMHHQFARL